MVLLVLYSTCSISSTYCTVSTEKDNIHFASKTVRNVSWSRTPFIHIYFIQTANGVSIFGSKQLFNVDDPAKKKTQSRPCRALAIFPILFLYRRKRKVSPPPNSKLTSLWKILKAWWAIWSSSLCCSWSPSRTARRCRRGSWRRRRRRWKRSRVRGGIQWMSSGTGLNVAC
jgi:hypothetical protein